MGRSAALAAAMLALVACAADEGSGPAGVRSVVVSAPFTSVVVGESVQLSATATDAAGSVVRDIPVSWSSSAPAVATVDRTGLVSAVAAGQVTVTAAAGGARGSLALTVTPPPAGAATVTMPGYSFVPHTTTIPVGGTVRFEFPALQHNVIFAKAAGAPADIQATANRTVSRTFPVAGTFAYDCTLHPGMSGVVVAR